MSHPPHTLKTVEELRREISRLRDELGSSRSWDCPESTGIPWGRVIEELPHLVCLFRPDGFITCANRAFCASICRTRTETVGSSLFGIIARKDRGRFMRLLESLSPSRPAREFEYRARIGKDEMRWYRWSLKALFGEAGRPLAHLLAGSDITLVKGIEEDFIDALERYATLFECANDAIVLLKGDRLVGCNTAALRIFHFADKKEFLKSTLTGLSPPDHAGRAAEGNELGRRTGSALERGYERFEWTFMRRDGSRFAADIILSPLPPGQGSIVAAIIRDISGLIRGQAGVEEHPGETARRGCVPGSPARC